MNRLLTIVDSKYKRLEYLQATGTQWINTGITRDNLYKWRFEGIVNFQNVSTRQIMGCGSAVYFGCVNGFWQIGQSGTNNTGKTISANTDYSFSIEINSRNSKYKATINGDTIDGTTAEQSYVNVVNLFIFSTDSHNYNYYAKLGYLKIYKDDVLVRNFVPVLRKTDNELGMLDLVEGKFYPNAGTGKFTANLDTMYAIIQGRPTQSPYGVFSGFSASNYLQIQNSVSITQSSNLEFYFKFTTPASFSYAGNYPVLCRLNNGNKVSMLGFYNLSGSVYARGSIAGNNIEDYSYTPQTNTTYYIKLTYANGVETLTLYDVDKNVLLTKSQSITITDVTETLYVGVTSGSHQGTMQSIDLNNSYIKLGSTKYNLQAVVGYTVVGSPTIVDGVVSGFSASNYLSFAQHYSGAYPSGRIAFTYERQSSMNQILLIIQSGSLFPFRIRTVDRTPQISWVDAENTQKNMLLSYSLVAGVYYSLSWEVKSGKIFFTLYDSLGNVLETKNQDISLGTTTSGSAKIGWYSTTSYWQGSIDLNNTYIKDGNKLWFNGQQA